MANGKFQGHYGDRKSRNSFSGGASDPVEIARIPNGESEIVIEKNTHSVYLAEQFGERKHYVILRNSDVTRKVIDALIKAAK
ncbi:hypothetical protein LCGC14_2513610 [marine sediment metagenome]|uniref:Uncharacterized protein n=1 Tax=marine sediment metagenome TaxID=412755 RepID=A0A0F9DA49_9ZZZZ